MSLDDPHLIIESGFVFTRGRVAPLLDHGAFTWIPRATPAKAHQISRPRARQCPGNAARPERWCRRSSWMTTSNTKNAASLRGWGSHQPDARVRRSHFEAHLPGRLWARLDPLRHPGTRALASGPAGASASRCRNRNGRPDTLADSAWYLAGAAGPSGMAAAMKPMPAVVRELLHAGWHVEAEGKASGAPGAARWT